jgi:ubiquinone/menaquinone biosynthesis C-methylase UbiE
MAAVDTFYFMDDRREAARLIDKVDAAAWVDKYLGFDYLPGSRVLEVGSGPGHLACELARRHRHIQVVASDASAELLSRLEDRSTPANVAPCRGEAHHLPFDDASFDVVYCRLVLQYLAAPHVAVHEMYRVLRPGGRVVLYDLDGQLLWHDPPDDELNETLGTAVAGLARGGFDPHIGRRLYNLAYRAAFVDIVTRGEIYHLIAGRVSPDERARWRLKLDIARPALTRIFATALEVDRHIEAFLAYLDREDTLTYSVAFAVTARRP